MQQEYINIFEKEISVFTASPFLTDQGKVGTTFTGHHVRTIGQFLDGGKYYTNTIGRLRATYTAALEAWNNGNTTAYNDYIEKYQFHKWDVPVAIPQGVNPTHSNNGFKSYTDVICLDIDTEKPHKGTNGNEWVKDWEQVKKQLSAIPFVAYCGLSIGGRGLFLLIPVKSHKEHQGHWMALAKLFKKHLNLTIDPATLNIGRLRFISHDPNAYKNTNAMVFDAVAEAEHLEEPTTRRRFTFTAQDDTEERIYRCMQEIQTRGIDITRSHDEWKKAGASLAHYMGERGRDVFHSIASQYPGYSEKENDTLYSNLLRSHATRDADIHSFFYLCKWYGVDISHHHTISIPTPRVTTANNGAGVAENKAVKKCKEVRQDAAPPPPSLASTMSMAEQEELKRMADHIKEGKTILEDMKKENPHIKKLCDTFQLEYYGHNGWNMTDAQFNAFMNTHPTPPF